MTPSDDRVIAVAVPVPGLGVLSYRVPAEAVVPPAGARVRVPLGTRTVVGIVVTAPPAPAGTSLKLVTEVIDDEPFLPAVVVALAEWVGEYYASGPGEALAMVVPPLARTGRSAFRTARVAAITDLGRTATVRGPRQRAALDLLRAAPHGLPTTALVAARVGSETLATLVGAGFVAIHERVRERDPFVGPGASGGETRWAVMGTAAEARTLFPEQAVAFERLLDAVARPAPRPVVLQGVTGSGKTEVYLQLARRVVAAGRRVLMLVPEIALTPAVAGTFRGRFGERVAIQHSALSPGERHDQWHRIRRGEVDVVVGTRSAVFAPLERVGLIIVDEEHDGSYKQDEAPRYNGRDVAVMRGRMERALVVLGSATPSMESAANAEAGRYDRLVLTRRIFDRPLAAVEIVDMRQEYARRGPDVILSTALADALAARLERREQAVVLLNRRGFSTVVFCRQCAATIECPHCSIALTYHRGVHRLRCHYCNHAQALPDTCTVCGGQFLEQSGFGTERLEAELRAGFPAARVARVDRDTVRRRGALTAVLARMARGEIDVLVGTQMIAKGHDFPAVTLVGVVSADVGLGLADFRAAERTFQLLTQVVGRAGRGETPGEAVIQTLYPDHYSIRAAAVQDYAAFYARERDFRARLQYPPAVALVNVVVKGRSMARALDDAADLAARVRRRHARGLVLGPAPAFLARLKDEHRAQFLVKGGRRNAMHAAVVAALAERPDLKKRTVVDVDPVSIV